MVTESLCGSAPITTLFNVVSLSLTTADHGHVSQRGGQRYFELGKPLFSHSLASGARQERMPEESHARRRAAATERPAEHLHQGPVGP